MKLNKSFLEYLVIFLKYFPKVNTIFADLFLTNQFNNFIVIQYQINYSKKLKIYSTYIIFVYISNLAFYDKHYDKIWVLYFAYFGMYLYFKVLLFFVCIRNNFYL